jgi:hypothetical protein
MAPLPSKGNYVFGREADGLSLLIPPLIRRDFKVGFNQAKQEVVSASFKSFPLKRRDHKGT